MPSPIISAGLLLYRRRAAHIEVFLIHPGGPYWSRKDQGAWSVPKGLLNAGEDALCAARREFTEETGFDAPAGAELALGVFRLPSGKQLQIWAVEGDCDPSQLTSNFFEMEWPPKSGRTARFPEADRAGWFEPDEALGRITKGQRAVLERLYSALG